MSTPKWQQLKTAGVAWFVKYDVAGKPRLMSLPVTRASAKQVTLGGYGPGSCTNYYVVQVEGLRSPIGEPSCSELSGRACLFATQREALEAFREQTLERIADLHKMLEQTQAANAWAEGQLDPDHPIYGANTAT